MDRDLLEWLETLPLNRPVEFEGEMVSLNTRSGGAELTVRLMESKSSGQLQEVLQLGFSSALHFDAGLACGPDNRTVFLSKWLSNVYSWPEAADALERILDQTAAWRAWLTPPERTPVTIDTAAGDRAQRRLLALIAERKA